MAEVLPRLHEADTALHNGDADPRHAMWSHNDPVTVFGAVTTKIGWGEIGPAFDWLASRFSDCGSFEYEVVAADASGDLGYIVGIEHTTASVGGAPPTPYSLRVTTDARRGAGTAPPPGVRSAVVSRFGSKARDEEDPMRTSMVRRGLSALVVVGAVLVSGPAEAEGTGGRPFRLELSGAGEFNAAGAPINPHGDADRGSVVLTLNQGQERVCWEFGEITLTSGEALPHVAHIHEAPVGFAGPVRVDLFGTTTTGAAPASYPTGTHCVHASAELIKAMRQNPENYYVNLHNRQHPGGVMRAQLAQ